MKEMSRESEERKEEWVFSFCPVQISTKMLDGGHVADCAMLAAPASSERSYTENAAGALINSNPEHEITLTDSLFICFKLNPAFLSVKL